MTNSYPSICSPVVVELVRSNLAPDFPLFHGSEVSVNPKTLKYTSTVLCCDQDKQVRSQRSVQQFSVIIMLKLTRRLLDSELLLAASRSLATSAPVLKPAQTQAAGESEAEPRPAPAQADTMTEMGTRDIFTADHDMFRSVVRSVLSVW